MKRFDASEFLGIAASPSVEPSSPSAPVPTKAQSPGRTPACKRDRTQNRQMEELLAIAGGKVPNHSPEWMRILRTRRADSYNERERDSFLSVVEDYERVHEAETAVTFGEQRPVSRMLGKSVDKTRPSDSRGKAADDSMTPQARLRLCFESRRGTSTADLAKMFRQSSRTVQRSFLKMKWIVDALSLEHLRRFFQLAWDTAQNRWPSKFGETLETLAAVPCVRRAFEYLEGPQDPPRSLEPRAPRLAPYVIWESDMWDEALQRGMTVATASQLCLPLPPVKREVKGEKPENVELKSENAPASVASAKSEPGKATALDKVRGHIAVISLESVVLVKAATGEWLRQKRFMSSYTASPLNHRTVLELLATCTAAARMDPEVYARAGAVFRVRIPDTAAYNKKAVSIREAPRNAADNECQSHVWCGAHQLHRSRVPLASHTGVLDPAFRLVKWMRGNKKTVLSIIRTEVPKRFRPRYSEPCQEDLEYASVFIDSCKAAWSVDSFREKDSQEGESDANPHAGKLSSWMRIVEVLRKSGNGPWHIRGLFIHCMLPGETEAEAINDIFCVWTSLLVHYLIPIPCKSRFTHAQTALSVIAIAIAYHSLSEVILESALASGKIVGIRLLLEDIDIDGNCEEQDDPDEPIDDQEGPVANKRRLRLSLRWVMGKATLTNIVITECCMISLLFCFKDLRDDDSDKALAKRIGVPDCLPLQPGVISAYMNLANPVRSPATRVLRELGSLFVLCPESHRPVHPAVRTLCKLSPDETGEIACGVSAAAIVSLRVGGVGVGANVWWRLYLCFRKHPELFCNYPDTRIDDEDTVELAVDLADKIQQCEFCVDKSFTRKYWGLFPSIELVIGNESKETLDIWSRLSSATSLRVEGCHVRMRHLMGYSGTCGGHVGLGLASARHVCGEAASWHATCKKRWRKYGKDDESSDGACTPSNDDNASRANPKRSGRHDFIAARFAEARRTNEKRSAREILKEASAGWRAMPQSDQKPWIDAARAARQYRGDDEAEDDEGKDSRKDSSSASDEDAAWTPWRMGRKDQVIDLQRLQSAWAEAPSFHDESVAGASFVLPERIVDDEDASMRQEVTCERLGVCLHRLAPLHANGLLHLRQATHSAIKSMNREELLANQTLVLFETSQKDDVIDRLFCFVAHVFWVCPEIRTFVDIFAECRIKSDPCSDNELDGCVVQYVRQLGEGTPAGLEGAFKYLHSFPLVDRLWRLASARDETMEPIKIQLSELTHRVVDIDCDLVTGVRKKSILWPPQSMPKAKVNPFEKTFKESFTIPKARQAPKAKGTKKVSNPIGTASSDSGEPHGNSNVPRIRGRRMKRRRRRSKWMRRVLSILPLQLHPRLFESFSILPIRKLHLRSLAVRRASGSATGQRRPDARNAWPCRTSTSATSMRARSLAFGRRFPPLLQQKWGLLVLELLRPPRPPVPAYLRPRPPVAAVGSQPLCFRSRHRHSRKTLLID